MSLEQSLERYAAALEKNADALEKHTEVMQRALDKGVVLIASNDAVPAAAPKAEKPAKTEEAKEEKPTRSRKSKEEAKPAPKEDADDFGDESGDDFEDESTSKSMSADDIRTLLMKVKDEKGADAARGILKELGVAAIAQIPEKDFDKAVKLAKKAGVSL